MLQFSGVIGSIVIRLFFSLLFPSLFGDNFFSESVNCLRFRYSLIDNCEKKNPQINYKLIKEK